MATVEQLMAALRKADAAGDTEAARRFASIINSARMAPPPAPPALDQSEIPIEGTGELFTEGVKRTTAAVGLAGAAGVGADLSGQAAPVTEALKSYQRPVPKQLEEAKGAFKEEAQMIEEAENWYSPKALGGAALGILEIGKQAITNPKGLWYMTAEQAANMAPGIVGNLGGLGLAAATGVGTVPALIAAAGLGMAAQTPVEAGAELIGMIGSELSKRKLDLNEENVRAVLTDKDFMREATKKAYIKGATTAAVDSVTTVGAGRLAMAPERAAIKAARAQLGSGATEEAVKAAAKTSLANRNVLQKLSPVAKGVGLDVVGGGASEAAGQLAAYGKANPEDVFQEMLGELGGAVVEVPAVARAMGDKALRGEALTATPPPPGATATPPPGATASTATPPPGATASTATPPPGATASTATPPPGATASTAAPPPGATASVTATPTAPTAADFGLTEDELKNVIAGFDTNIASLEKIISDTDVKLASAVSTAPEFKTLTDQKRFALDALKTAKQQRSRYAPLPSRKKPRAAAGAGSWVSLEDARQAIAAVGDETKPGDWSKALETAFPILAGKDKGRARGIILSELKKAGHVSGVVKGKRTIVQGEHWNNPIAEPARRTPKAIPKTEADTLLADVDFTPSSATPVSVAATPAAATTSTAAATTPTAAATTSTAAATTPTAAATTSTAAATTPTAAATTPTAAATTPTAAATTPTTAAAVPTTAATTPTTAAAVPTTAATTPTTAAAVPTTVPSAPTPNAAPTGPKFTAPLSYEEHAALSPEDKLRYGDEIGMPPLPPARVDVAPPAAPVEEEPDVFADLDANEVKAAAKEAARQQRIDDARAFGEISADSVFGRRGDYESYEDAVDSGQQNIRDTLNEQKETDPEVINAALLAYDTYINANVSRWNQAQTEAQTTGTQVTEAPVEKEVAAAPSNYDRAVEYVKQPKADITVKGLSANLGVNAAEARKLITQLKDPKSPVIVTKGNKNVYVPPAPVSSEPAAESTGTGVPATGGRKADSRKRTPVEPVPGGVGTAGVPAGQPAAGAANVPGTLTGGRRKTKKQLAEEQKAAERKTPYIAEEADREVYRQAIINLQSVGAMPVPVSNTLIKRLADDGEVGRPSMTDKTYDEMITAINKASRLAEQGKKPEAPAKLTASEIRNAAVAAWDEATKAFEGSLTSRQIRLFNNGTDVSKLGLNEKQGKLYERMEELREEHSGITQEIDENSDAIESRSESTDLTGALERSEITSPAKLADTADIVADQEEPTLTEEQLKNWLNARPRSPLELLDLIIRTSDNAMYRNIAAMIRPLYQRLTASGALIVTNPITTYKTKAHGHVKFTYTRYDVEARINLSRTDYKTALHELIHIAFEPMVELAKTAYLNKENNELSRIYDDYVKLGNAIGKKLVKLYPRGKTARAFVNNPTLQRLSAALDRVRNTNIFGTKEVTVKASKNAKGTTQTRTVTTYDLREIFTWALTDEDAALVLDAMPSIMGPPLFQKFVSLVRRVIGSPVTTQTALTDILDLSRRISQAQVEGATINFNPKKFVDIAEARRPVRIPAPPRPSATPEEQIEAGAAEITEELKLRPPLWQRIKNLFTNKGYEETVRLRQNDRRVLKSLQDAMKLAKRLRYENHPALGGFNNLYDRIVNASGKTFKIMSNRFTRDLEAMDSMIRELAKKDGTTVEKALAKVDRVLKALHYGERRRTLFALYAPLNDTPKYTVTMPDGSKQQVGAATLRSMILEKLRSNTAISDTEVKKYHDIIWALTEPGGPQSALDPNGISQANMPGEPVASKGTTKFTTDINNDTYSPLGPRTAAEVASMEALYNNERATLEPIVKLAYKILETQRQVDQESNFWSQGVENLRRFYAWDNYVPLKNIAGVKYSLHHNMVEPRSKRYSPEFRSDLPSGMGGRISEPKNVILQIQVDAVKAASRLGRQDSTEAIRNAIKEGFIYDNPKKRLVVPFSDRYKGFNAIQYRGNEWFVYYAPNGSIEIYQLTDQRQREAIRRTRDSEPMGALLQTLAAGTSFIGKGFTRWNLKFAPKDFIRNAVFGAGIFGLEMGPKKAGEFISRIASRTMHDGMRKGWKVWKLYETGNMAELERLSTTDQFYKSTFEYLNNGGAVTYVQQFAQQGRIADVIENYKKSGWKQKVGNGQKFVNLMLDCWVQAFEVTVRSVAYDMYKQDLLAKGVSEEAAQVSAAAQAKELTNFESVGAKAQELAAAFAFFRASSTGAVRTMDALRPLVVKDVKTLLEELPAAVKTDPVAIANAEKQLKEAKRNAQYTSLLALGTGAALYMIARSFAGDDEVDRNLVASDKKEQWTRALRIPLSTFGMEDESGESVLSIPWGFGIGAFMAWGAQVMAWGSGDQSTREFVGNSVQVGLDSFFPVPIARFNPFDPANKLDTGTATLAWVVDSASPTIIRPAIEHLMGINGLGQELYRDSTNSYGDAYATSESVPEMYNALAANLEEFTNGAIDMQPTTLYFILNNYVSAFAQAASTNYGMFTSLIGDKEFSLRKDLPILSTFISRRTPPDASEYARTENFVKKQELELKKLRNFEDPARLYAYLDEHPYADYIVDNYRDHKKQIDRLQEDRNRITRGYTKFATPKERSEMVKYYTDEINRLKRASTERYNYFIEAEKDLKD
jgi:hypothetical protein